ncbi:hypothetical protein [Piscinibacter sp.]|uniref:hypothetical protein n=1 Tax=Piscinibacter sp. TaxID=1903157 RepID=UPI001E179C10|nr:hypothetical protein [Piscinibacter sp.]MBK7533262.1 hypothetical protein [Piscinibacter sp.]
MTPGEGLRWLALILTLLAAAGYLVTVLPRLAAAPALWPAACSLSVVACCSC